MGHLRFPDGVGAGLLLESAIGPGQPVVALSHMLCPGADEVGPTNLVDSPPSRNSSQRRAPVRLRERPTWRIASVNARLPALQRVDLSRMSSVIDS